jgi:hypothetical protein
MGALSERTSTVESDRATHVVGDIGEPDAGLRPVDPDGADEKAHRQSFWSARKCYTSARILDFRPLARTVALFSR